MTPEDKKLNSVMIDVIYNLSIAVRCLADRVGHSDIGDAADEAKRRLEAAIIERQKANTPTEDR